MLKQTHRTHNTSPLSSEFYMWLLAPSPSQIASEDKRLSFKGITGACILQISFSSFPNTNPSRWYLVLSYRKLERPMGRDPKEWTCTIPSERRQRPYGLCGLYRSMWTVCFGVLFEHIFTWASLLKILPAKGLRNDPRVHLAHGMVKITRAKSGIL